MSARKTLDIDFITLRKIRAVDPATNALITPNYILAMDTEGQAQWVNTLSNINTYGGLTGMTGPTGPINPAALLTVTGGPIPGLIGYIGQTIPHNVPTVVQLPNVDISNSTTNINIGIVYDPVTGSFTNDTMTPLQLLLTWQIAWTNETPITYSSLTTYAEVSGLYIDPLQSKFGYTTITDVSDVTYDTVQSSSCVIYLDICDKFYIYAKQTNSENSSTLISGSTPDMALGYSTKLTITLVQTGPKGDTGPIGPTGPTGPIAPLVTENFIVAGGDGPDMKFSYNGLIWNPCDLSSSMVTATQCNAIAWSGNLWTAGFTPSVSGDNPLVYFAYSSDGIHWYPGNSSGLNITGCNAIAWNGVLWTAGVNSSSGNTILAYSYDGINWTSSPSTFGTTSGCNTVAWNGSIWVAGVSDSSTFQYLYSYDGINWIQSQTYTLGVNAQVNTVAYNGLIWVAGGERSTSLSLGDSNLANSYDGITWISSSSPLLNAGCNSVAWNGYMWVAGGEPDSSGNTIIYSYDGQTWIDSSSGSSLLSTGCNTVSWNGSIWFAGGNVCPDYAIYSNDGINWQMYSEEPFNTILLTSAARRPLPYVGKTIVPPVLNQYVGPRNGAITYVSPSGGTGLNDIYYSRFVTIHESGPVGTGTLEVYGTVQIGPTASITYDVSNDLVFNTTLLPDLSDSYTIGNHTHFWKDLYVGTGGVHIGPTGTITGDQDKNLVLNTTLLPDVSDAYTLGSPSQFWKDLYVGTGGVHIGRTGTVTADQNNNLVLNTTLLPDISDAYTLGSPSQFWKDLYVGTGGVHIGPTGTVTADQSNNLVLNTTLLPNTGYAYNLGSLEKPWTGVYVGTGSVHIGPTGTISADPNNLVFNTSLLPDLSDSYTLGSPNQPWQELFVGTAGVQMGPFAAIASDSSSNVTITFNGILDVTNNVATGRVYDTVFNPVNTNPSAFCVAVGRNDSNGNNIIYSSNGADWNTVDASSNDLITNGYGVAYNGSIWLAGGGYSTASIIYSSDGIHWSPSLDSSNILQRVDSFASNGPMWIAGGQGPYSLAYSYDGISWTGVPDSTVLINQVFTVAWNGYMWLAGGTGINKLAYSYDGLHWTSVTTSLTDVNGVCWNGTMWVAVGDGSTSVEYSYNGINWTPVSADDVFPGGQGRGIAWNGSLWVAIGSGSPNTFAYSLDGINWTPSGNGILNIGNGICWNGTYWVGVGTKNLLPSGQTVEVYSVDAINWSLSSNTLLTSGYGVASRRPLPFVGQTVVPPVFNQGVGPTGGALLYSSPSGGTGLNDMYYSRFLTVTENGGTGTFGVNGTIDIGPTGSIFADTDGNLVMGIVDGLYLTNGIVTSQVYDEFFNPPPSADQANLSTDNFTIAGSAVDGTITYSYNGTKWSSSISTGLTSISGIAWNGALWIAVGEGNPDTQPISYSSDGIHWINQVNGIVTDYFGSGIAWNGSMWILIGDGPLSTFGYYSYDGVNWNSITNNLFNTNLISEGSSIAWNGYMWVAVGSGNTYQIAYSYDGINWTGTGTGIFDECNGIAWNGTRWVAVGNPVSPITSNATIAYSSDGKLWEPVANSSTNNFYQGNDVAWNGSLWVAVGGNDDARSRPVATSIDGITWTNQTFEDMIPYGIAWNGSVWIAVGQDAGLIGASNIAYSPNGINWSSTTPPITATSFNAVASRRPLPFVGETVVPPVFNQGSGTGGALMYTSPTGTNDMYYSRFLSLTESTETLVVNGSIQIGPTGSISYDVSNLIINTNLLPDISNSYTLGSTGRPWAQLFVSPSGIHIGPTGSVVADQSGNLVFNTNLLPSTGYAYNLGSPALPWQELYVGTGSVHVGPTGTISADQSGNLILGDLSGNGFQLIPYYNTGPMLRPAKSGEQLLFQASSGSDYVFLNSGAMGPQNSTLSLGQPNFHWNGLHVSPTGIYFSPGPTIKADITNVFVSSNLSPDISNTHNLGSPTLPWNELFVGPTGIQIGPTGSVSTNQNGNLILGDVSGNGLEIVTNIASGVLLKPINLTAGANAQLLFQAATGNDLVYLNSQYMAPQNGTISLGQPSTSAYWNGLYISGEGIHFKPGPTIQADSSNVIVSSNLIVGNTNGLLITPDVSGGPLLSPTNGGTQLLLGTDPSNYLFINPTQFGPNQSPTGPYGFSLGTSSNYWYDLYINYPLLNAPKSNALNYFWNYTALLPNPLGTLTNGGTISIPTGSPNVSWTTTNPEAPFLSDSSNIINLPQDGIYRITLNFLLGSTASSGSVCIYNITTMTTLAYSNGVGSQFSTITTDNILNANDQICIRLGPGDYSGVTPDPFTSLSISLLTALF